jgi:hypothetical protein
MHDFVCTGVIPLRSSFITRSRGDGCVDGRSFCFEINTADRTYIMSGIVFFIMLCVYLV